MHRENTISEHLIDLLDIYPEVNISGIGVFAIISKAAWIDVHNNELYPPTKTLCIRPESSTAIEFVSVIKGQMQENLDGFIKLEERLKSYVTELKDSRTLRIEGVGVISKGEDQQLNLFDVHSQWGEATTYLPVLEIYPVSKPANEAEANIADIATDVNTQKDFSEPVSFQEVGKQSLLPLIVLCLGVMAFLWYLKGCEQTKLSNEIKIQEASKVKTSDLDTSSTLNSKYAAYLSPEIIEEGCKIVVGSYSERGNAASQLTKLSGSAYTVQLSQNDNAYRVIIVFNCNDYNLKEYLEKVKEELAPNAWYLSPNIKTEDL